MWCMPACARRNPATFLMGQKWGGPHWTDHSALWGREPDERQLVGWLHRPVAVISIVRRQKVWVKVKQQCLPGLLRRRTVCVPSGGEAGDSGCGSEGGAPRGRQASALRAASARSPRPAAFSSGLGAPPGAQPRACQAPVPVTSHRLGRISVLETRALFGPAPDLCSPRLRNSGSPLAISGSSLALLVC